MSDDRDELRTHEPTTRRLAEARRRGQVVRSSELSGNLAMLAGLAAIGLLGGQFVTALRTMLAAGLGESAAPALEASQLSASLSGTIWPLLGLTALVLAAIVAAAVLAGVAQVGLVWSTQLLTPDWRRVQMSTGMKRVVSWRTIVKLALTLVKLAASAAVGWWTIGGSWGQFAVAGDGDVAALAGAAGSAINTLAWRLGAMLLAVGVLDLLYQRWQHRRDLRMSRRELLEDLRQDESGRMIRGRRGNKARGVASAPATGAALAGGAIEPTLAVES